MTSAKRIPFPIILLLIAIAIGALLRFVWVGDMEYKGDEAYMVDAVHRVHNGEPLPALGMPSSANLKNPAASLWVFIIPAKLLGLHDPLAIVRIVQVLAVAAIAGVALFAWRAVPQNEREPWLWAAAMAALSAPAIIFERKIWAQSILPIFSLFLLMGWWYRDRRAAAFAWGAVGALVGQIHMSGFFFAAALALWTLLFARTSARWRWWIAGSVVGTLPMIPWITYLLGGPAVVSEGPVGRGWFGIKFYLLWLTQAAGFEDMYHLLGPQFLHFIAGPRVADRPTYLAAALMLLVAAMLGLVLLKGLYILWQGRSNLLDLLTGRKSQTTLAISAAVIAFGILLTIAPIRVFRYYLIIAFPLAFVWLARIALANTSWRIAGIRAGRVALAVICLSNGLLAGCFLHHVHQNQGAPNGYYGVAYNAQGAIKSPPRHDPSYANSVMLAAFQVPDAAPRAEVNILVKAGEALGPTPRTLRPGFFTFAQVPPDFLADKIFKELKVGTVEVDLGRDILENAADIDDLLVRVAQVEPFLQKARAEGALIVLGFSKIPRFVSSRPNDTSAALPGDTTPVAVVAPPKSDEAWADVMTAIARYMRERNLAPWYKIGWEPDTRNFFGTQDEFFRMYRASVLGVKRGDPAAKIGGPGVITVGPHWKNPADATPMLEAFIGYCSRTGIPELKLNRLPLDFLAFHLFDGNPLTSPAAAEDVITAWLKKYGYDAQTPLFVGEWSDTGSPFSKHREEPYIAAFAVGNMIAMERLGIDAHAFTSLVEQQTKENTEFAGGFGVFTKHFIPRPSYQAFRAMSELPDTQVLSSSSDPWVFAAAARDADRIVVVAANVVPTPEAFMRMFVDRILQKGLRPADVARAFKDENALKAFLRGEGSASGPLAADLNAIRTEMHRYLPTLQKRGTEATTLGVVVQGTAFLGNMNVREYRITAGQGIASDRLKREIDRAFTDRAKQAGNVAAKIDATLQARGYGPSDIAQLKAVAGAGDKNRALAQLPADQRKRVLTMIREVVDADAAEVGKIAENFSQRDELAWKPAQERAVGARDSVNLVADVTANTVIVFVLEKSR